MALINLVYLPLHIGADSGFDGICETQGACRGAVGLVKSRKWDIKLSPVMKMRHSNA